MMDQWHALGWTLVHFLWQAAAIAALYRIADLLLPRSSATVRYAMALAALGAMLIASLATLAWEEAGNRTEAAQGSAQALSFSVAGPPLPASVAQSATMPEAPRDNAWRFDMDSMLPWLDAMWLAGVLCLSLRAVGGCVFLERLRRAALEEAPHALWVRLDVLRRELGIRMCIDLRLSERIGSPLTAGVLRPWILLPCSALTNLTPEQLEMVLLHELAHMRRGDYLWNLMQTGMETLFFFHPAVWWVSRRVREERELCCDDMALECCCDPAVYASALLRLEEERRAQLRFAMALDGGSRRGLRARIERILGSPEASTEQTRFRPVSIAVLAAALVIFACPVPQVLASLHQAPMAQPGADAAASQTASPDPAQPAPQAKPSAAVPADAEAGTSGSSSAPSTSPDADSLAGARSSGPDSADAEADAQQSAAPAAGANAQNGEHSDYIDAMRAAGYKVDLDKYIAMKVQGITPEYAAAMAKEFGHNIPADQLIAMKVQAVTPEYMSQMRAAGYDADLDKYIAMKVQAITPEYAAEMAKQFGQKIPVDQLIAMKVQDLTPDYMAKMRVAGYDADLDKYIAMKVQAITPEYAAEMAKAGFGKPSVDQLIALKVQGVTPDYADKLRSSGIEVSSFNDLIADRIFAVTLEFVEQMKAAGFGTIPPKKLVALRVQGVTPEYARNMKAQFPDVTVDQLIQLRVFHIDADFIASATRHGFGPLSIDKLVKLRISGILDDAKESRP